MRREIEANNPSPCRQASQTLSGGRHRWQTGFRLLDDSLWRVRRTIRKFFFSQRIPPRLLRIERNQGPSVTAMRALGTRTSLASFRRLRIKPNPARCPPLQISGAGASSSRGRVTVPFRFGLVQTSRDAATVAGQIALVEPHRRRCLRQ